MPGSGKSTLARALADAIQIPLLSRDEIYSGLAYTGPDERSLPPDLAQIANTALTTSARSLLNAGVSVIIEAAFQHKLWVVVLESLRSLADTRVIRCVIAPELALQRMVRRLDQAAAQRAVHQDTRYIRERLGPPSQWPRFEPILLAVPTMDVETTDGYSPSFNDVVGFACAR